MKHSTQSNPADVPTICGENSSLVETEINNLCSGDNTEAALEAFSSVCGNPVGK